MPKEKTVKGLNSQQCLMIQGMFGLKPQTNVIKVGVKEKHEGLKFDLEVIPSGEFVAFRSVINGSESLWSTWDSPEQVENWFRVCSLL